MRSVTVEKLLPSRVINVSNPPIHLYRWTYVLRRCVRGRLTKFKSITPIHTSQSVMPPPNISHTTPAHLLTYRRLLLPERKRLKSNRAAVNLLYLFGFIFEIWVAFPAVIYKKELGDFIYYSIYLHYVEQYTYMQ